MAKDVVLPQLGQSMHKGTIVKICVEIGQAVAADEVVFEIETDKATLEVESSDAGFVKAVLVEIGQTVPVHTPILVLGEADEDVTAYLEGKIRHSFDSAEATATTASSKGVPPQIQMVALEMGVDLSTAVPAEAIRTLDAQVRKSPADDATAVQEYQLGQTLPLTRLQKITAEKMVWSKQNIPCFYLNVRVHATRLAAFRDKLNEDAQTKISFNDLILRALTLGIEHYPIMTGKLAEDHIQLSEQIDIGLAVATDDGLVAPILKDCGKKNLYELSAACAELVERAKSKKLTMDDLEGGALTISNLGRFGVDSFIPIVVPGQSSILGIGSIQDAVLPVDKAPSLEKIMNMTLSVDHKVINGAEAAQFLDFVKKRLEHPDELIPAEEKPKAETVEKPVEPELPIIPDASSKNVFQKIFGRLFGRTD